MPDHLKVLLLVLSQLPVFGGLYLFSVGRIPSRLGSLLILIAYEGGVFLITFWRKIWKENFENRIAHLVAKKTEEAVSHPLFVRRFMGRLIADYRAFNVKGLDNINPLKLEQVFVELRIKSSNVHAATNWLFKEGAEELKGNRPIWDFIKQAESEEYDTFALAILGAPGSGKTTLLQNTAITLAVDGERKKHLNRFYIPVLLFLREFAEKIVKERLTLHQLLQEHFGDQNKFPTLNPPSAFFEEQLKDGKCLVMLDGLDEVAGIENKEKVSEWVDEQIKNYPRSRFILTARPQGYRIAPLQLARVLEVMPFNGIQIQKFVENWYLAHASMESGDFDLELKKQARDSAQNLISRLREMPSLNAMTVNPLLLTMIVIVHHYHGALPGGRHKLYAELCDVLLERRHAAKKITVRFTAKQSLSGLEPLAAHMMETRVRDLDLVEVLRVINEPLKVTGLVQREIQDFPSELELSSGLLLETDVDRWSFAHLSFQEYLAAAHWLRQKKLDQNWEKLVHDAWWYEAIRFYAGQTDATPIAKACLKTQSTQSLMLLADFTSGSGSSK